MDLFFISVGLVSGFLIGWLFTLNRKAKAIGAKQVEVGVLKEKHESLSAALDSLSKNLEIKQDEVLNLNRQLASKSSDFNNQLLRNKEQQSDLENLQDRFRTEFKNLANEILEEKSRVFTQQNKENINDILAPLGVKLKEFEQKVQNTYEKGVRDQGDLKVELKRLHDLSLRLDEDARNLTRALKSDSKKQGNWGEIVLERILERSGLVKGREYLTQKSVRDENGLLARPDIVILLPENKHLIIDSKVSLTAYESFVNAETELLKEKFLKNHIESVKNHVKELGNKSYQSNTDFDSPDFVLLFMPIESAFSVALQNDSSLFSFAWDRKIVMVSPTTLLATLRTIESIWKHEKQTQNALEIARQGGNLYDKFVSFVKDFEKIGLQLSNAQKTYDETHKKLVSGKDNLIRKSERLRDLGANTKKNIAENLLDG
jgi:DNA recombination protein RmuC